MPTRAQIESEISVPRADGARRKYHRALAALTQRDTIVYASAFLSSRYAGRGGAVETDDMQHFMSALHGLKSDKLDLVLHSPGGSPTAAEQIVEYLRAKYEHIRAIVPMQAMSAATMIACACDEIVMGKHSAIGPIDPQIPVSFPDGDSHYHYLPAQSIVDEINRAKKDVTENEATLPFWVARISRYPSVSVCEDQLSFAEGLVAGWLERYMLRDNRKAKRVAQWLSNSKKHKDHSRPIFFAKAKKEGLNVVALESNQKLQDAVLSLFHATMTTFERTNVVKIVENQNGGGGRQAVG